MTTAAFAPVEYRPDGLATVAVSLFTVTAAAGVGCLVFVASPKAGVVAGLLLVAAAAAYTRAFARQKIEVREDALVLVRLGAAILVPYSSVVRSVVEFDPRSGVVGLSVQRLTGKPLRVTFWPYPEEARTHLLNAPGLRVELMRGNEPPESALRAPR